MITVTSYTDIKVTKKWNRKKRQVKNDRKKYDSRSQSSAHPKKQTAAHWGPEDLWCKACFWLPMGDEEQNGKKQQ